MTTLRFGHDYEYCTLRTREDFVLSGRNPKTRGKNVYRKQCTELAASDSEYADDTAIPFCTQADAEKYTPLLMEHFGTWTSRKILPPFRGFKDRIIVLRSPPINVPRSKHVWQHGYE